VDTTVCLVRHGRTELNAGGRLRGRIGVPLDQAGTEQAERLAELFATVSLAAVIASPPARAVQTAEPIAMRHRLEVETDWGMADRDWGPLAGQEGAEVAARFGTVDDAPGIEPAGAFRRPRHRQLRGPRCQSRRPAGAGGRPRCRQPHPARPADPGAGTGRGIGQRTGCWNLLPGREGAWSAPLLDALPSDSRNHPHALTRGPGGRRSAIRHLPSERAPQSVPGWLLCESHDPGPARTRSAALL
jgi:hypothetical protein